MMSLSAALPCAQEIARQLDPFCSRVLIAGSVRRKCEELRDIEICVIPKPDPVAHGYFCQLVASWDKIKGEPTGKYTRRRVPSSPLELDLFICSAQTWTCNTLIRTGCAEFSKAVMIRAQLMGWRFLGGRLYGAESKVVQVAGEADVFAALGLPCYLPEQRTQETAKRLSRIALPCKPAPRETDLFGEPI